MDRSARAMKAAAGPGGGVGVALALLACALLPGDAPDPGAFEPWTREVASGARSILHPPVAEDERRGSIRVVREHPVTGAFAIVRYRFELPFR